MKENYMKLVIPKEIRIVLKRFQYKFNQTRYLQDGTRSNIQENQKKKTSEK